MEVIPFSIAGVPSEVRFQMQCFGSRHRRVEDRIRILVDPDLEAKLRDRRLGEKLRD